MSLLAVLIEGRCCWKEAQLGNGVAGEADNLMPVTFFSRLRGVWNAPLSNRFSLAEGRRIPFTRLAMKPLQLMGL